uniref:Transposase n=1 Tax=Ascaris lumbricoides TaxID=6252 RepID=A0A0M3IKK2_ASCLU
MATDLSKGYTLRFVNVDATANQRYQRFAQNIVKRSESSRKARKVLLDIVSRTVYLIALHDYTWIITESNQLDKQTAKFPHIAFQTICVVQPKFVWKPFVGHKTLSLQNHFLRITKRNT